MPYVEYSLGGGLNLKAAPDKIADGELQTAHECEFDESGAVATRRSRAELQALSSEIRGEGDAVLDGTRYRISKAGTAVYLDDTSLGTFTGTNHISVVTYNNYAYITDGTTFKRYSTANGLEAVGYDTPTTAITGVIATDTTTPGQFAATADGVAYKWVYTFYNGVAESNFSPVFEDTFDTDEGHHATQNKMTLTIPVGPTGTTERRIYRTDANGSHFFRVGEIEDNTTTEFVDYGGLPAEADAEATSGAEVTDRKRELDSIAKIFGTKFPWGSTTAATSYDVAQWDTDVVMTNLGILANWTDHDPPPDDIRHLRFLTETLYGISGNSLRFTLTSAPEHWSEYNQVPIGRQTGETLRAIEPLGQDMICYTDAGIWKFRRIGVEAEQSILERADSPVGLAAEWAVADVYVRGGQPAGHVFLAKSGVYLFDGRTVIEISQKVEDIFTEASHEDSVNLDGIGSAVAASLRDQVLISYAHGSTNDRTLFIDFQDPSDIKFAIWKVGYTTLHRDQDNKIIGGTSDGGLYELLTGTAESITWAPKSKAFPIAGNTVLEAADRVVIDADLGGVTTTLTVATDRGDATSWTLTGSGRQKYRKLIPYYFKANSISVALRSTGTGKRTWYGVGFGYDEMPPP